MNKDNEVLEAVATKITYKTNGDVVVTEATQNNTLAPQDSNTDALPKAKRKRGRPPGKTALQLTANSQADLTAMSTKQHNRKATVFKTIEVVNALVESIGQGKFLLDITDKKGMPSYKTVMTWMATDKDFHDTIKTAYKTWAIAIMGINDRILRGDPEYSTGNFQRDDAIVKRNDRLINKMNIDWFGDKVQVEHTVHQAIILDDSIMGTLIDDGNDGF